MPDPGKVGNVSDRGHDTFAADFPADDVCLLPRDFFFEPETWGG